MDLYSLTKGWRHLKGYPVRGQRTWTNAWTSYKSNIILRAFRSKQISSNYNLSLAQSEIVILAEKVNDLWKINWIKEWRLAQRKRIKFLKNKYGIYRINLYNLAQNNIININKLKKKKK